MQKNKVFFLWTFFAFFQFSSLFYIRNWFHEEKFQIPPPSGFSRPPKKPAKLWVIYVGRILWLLQEHNLSTIVYYSNFSRKVQSYPVVSNFSTWLGLLNNSSDFKQTLVDGDLISGALNQIWLSLGWAWLWRMSILF